MSVLITGGAGYIGSTIASACEDSGIMPVVLDDLSAGRPEFAEQHAFYHGDTADLALLDRIFAEHQDIDVVLHCAAQIVVPESVRDPLSYYHSNVGKTILLLKYLPTTRCRRFIFSSSASIYAPAPDFSVDETSPLAPASPYAHTKAMAEQVIADTCASSDLRALSLRYFNPIGCDPLFRTGQQIAAPSHALGALIDAYRSCRPFTVTGTDWPTADGTGIRDYIDVWDLAGAHVAAITAFDTATSGATHAAINLGTGRGTTVRELIAAFRSVVTEPPDVVESPRRAGDVVGVFTRTERAASVLGWRALIPLSTSIERSLEWVARRPGLLGY